MHNDLKLDNVLIGLKDPKVIYLIDFGISTKFLHDDGSHTEKKFYDRFAGNFMFSSLNGISKASLSRRDDLQSLIYMLLFLSNAGKLPWSDFAKKFKGRNMSFDDYLQERLEVTYTKKVLDMCPSKIKQQLKNSIMLRYHEKPNYEEFTEVLKDHILKEMSLGPDLEPIAH